MQCATAVAARCALLLSHLSSLADLTSVQSTFGGELPCPDNDLAQPVGHQHLPSVAHRLTSLSRPPQPPLALLHLITFPLTALPDQLHQNEDATFLATLADICGADFPTTTCCTLGQLEVLSASLQQAEPLIATCEWSLYLSVAPGRHG